MATIITLLLGFRTESGINKPPSEISLPIKGLTTTLCKTGCIIFMLF